MLDQNKREVPRQIAKLNRAVEVLAKMEFTDLEEVRRIAQGIRWDLAEVNLELSELLQDENPREVRGRAA
jgi:hypothetical protein